MDQEVVARIDLEPVARSDEGGGGVLLDQQRAVEGAARPEVDAIIDRHLLPAARGIDPDLAALAGPGRCRLGRARGGRRPVEEAAADDAQRRDGDAPARLDVAEQALVLGLEGLARGRRVEGGAQRHAYRPLLAVVTQVDLASDGGRAVGETLAAERLAGAALELGEAGVEARAI